MIRFENVSKIFGTGVAGLSDITLSIDKGEFVFLVGQTGSGKTTMLRLMIAETLPTKGSLVVGETDVATLPAKKIPHFRKKIGVVFQDLKLLMDRTIFENILLPLEVAGVKVDEAQKRAEALLSQVGLLLHKEKFPIQLSGGEMQRVAIARALALSPEVLLADEPTGNLDDKTAFEIVGILEDINKNGTTVVMATHNIKIVEKVGTRVITLEHGKVIGDKGKSVKREAQSDKTKEGEADVIARSEATKQSHHTKHEK